MQIIVLILLSFSLIAFLNKKTTNFNLNSQSQLTIYPDQLRVKDDFLSGTGHFKGGDILIIRIIMQRKRFFKELNLLACK